MSKVNKINICKHCDREFNYTLASGYCVDCCRYMLAERSKNERS